MEDLQEKSLEELLKLAYKRYDEETVIRTNLRVKAGVLMAGILTFTNVFSKTLIDLLVGTPPKFYSCSVSVLVVALGILWLLSIIFDMMVFMPKKYGGTIFDAKNRTQLNSLLRAYKTRHVENVKDMVLENIVKKISRDRGVNEEKEYYFLSALVLFLITVLITITLQIVLSYDKKSYDDSKHTSKHQIINQWPKNNVLV